MGIKETLMAIENAWYTVTSEGFPLYRLNDDGTPVTPTQREEAATLTAQKHGLPVNTAAFLRKPAKTVAYA